MAEAPGSRLPSGHDEKFVSEVEDDCHCLICQLPLKEPVLTRCGHRFCKECIEEHLRRQEIQVQPLTCPADREPLDRDRDVFPDKATGRKILSLAIKCPSADCDWTGELRNKEVHLETCPLKVVSCTNENCHVTLKRKELVQHVTTTCRWRITECEYCGEPHRECHMLDHIEKCNKFPLPCPYNCGGSIPREMILRHIEIDCPLTLVSCPYVQMGCKEEVQRKDIQSHLQSTIREHLDLACVKLSNINDTQVQLNETQVQLKETQVQLKETQAQLRLTRNQLSNTQKATGNLEKKVEELQKQLEIKTNADEKNNNTRFIWKISKFQEIFRKAKSKIKETIFSDPFYTEPYGYKLQVIVILNGSLLDPDGNNHLAVKIVVKEGEYDALLPWPFNKEVAFTLFDQQENPEERENVVHYLSPKGVKQNLFLKRPNKEGIPTGRIPRFISHEKLQTRRYLADDTLFIQVEVSPP